MSWDLAIKIYFNSIDIKHSDQRNFVSTGPAYVKIALLPLIFKKIYLNQISVTHPVAYISRLEDDTF